MLQEVLKLLKMLVNLTKGFSAELDSRFDDNGNEILQGCPRMSQATGYWIDAPAPWKVLVQKVMNLTGEFG